MNIVIKQMQTDDEIRGKAYVHWSSWQDTYKGMVDEGYLESLTLEKCTERAFQWRDNVLVAKDGARVVGFVGYGKSGDLANCGEIFALYVLAGYRGMGIGARLLFAAIKLLKDYKKLCIWALKENERALRFYRKHGFRPDGAEKFVPSISAYGVRLTLPQERSCGAVVFTREGGEIRYAIVGNLGSCHGFPKGHIEEGEKENETAAREIKEETSLDVRFLDGFLEEDSYYIRGGTVLKTVVYFLAEFEGQTPVPQESEISSIKLLPFERAYALLEHENARSILKKADEFLKKQTF